MRDPKIFAHTGKGETMALCKDCVHYELCKRNGATVDFPVDDGVCLTFATPESLRPVGRWHLNEDGKWACTYCDGLAVEHPDEPDKWQALTRYCPNCGARMKERKEQ